MPEYLYICPNKHEVYVSHPMGLDTEIYCSDCGEVMHRKPQPFRVNWNGLKPSQGTLAPAIQKHLEDYEARK